MALFPEPFAAGDRLPGARAVKAGAGEAAALCGFGKRVVRWAQ
jgi:hypothetical protein